MYDKSLEQLIDAVIADGVITDKERKVVRNKAKELELNPDEIEVVLESRLQQKLDKEDEKNESGSSRRCPACGEIISAMSGVCPACGHVVKLNKTDGKDVMRLLDTLQQDLVTLEGSNIIKYLKNKATVEMSLRKAKTFYGDNKKVQSLVIDIEGALKKCSTRFYALIVIMLIVVLGSVFSIKSCVSENNAEKKQQMETQMQLVDKEYERVMAELNALEAVNDINFEDVETQLLKITWNPVVDTSGGADNWNEAQSYAYEKKESYLRTKRQIADRIYSFYKREYGKEAFSIAPDPIRASTFIHN